MSKRKGSKGKVYDFGKAALAKHEKKARRGDRVYLPEASAAAKAAADAGYLVINMRWLGETFASLPDWIQESIWELALRDARKAHGAVLDNDKMVFPLYCWLKEMESSRRLDWYRSGCKGNPPPLPGRRGDRP